jgi:hypothetical protein
MDEELQQLEAELKRLRPAPPSRKLEVEIARELDTAVQLESGSRWLWWGALPAAAAVAILMGVSLRRDYVGRPAEREPVTTLESGLLKPVAAENILYAARDEGLVMLADGTPARRERWSYVDTIVWKNPQTNASLKWSVPREEVRVVPVVFQ